ncbi:antibiotic biosynthesis monooxygenase family protein [Corticicoccus populi]|uniref:Signal transduction protein TRAP n=1 Tax=Corticicoccus populi TaxID=1812821 RepID=A0ABW5WRN9_9STAP
MILEAAFLQVTKGREDAFEASFRKASDIISSMNGYNSHELQRCLETEGKYLLLVRWQTLEDHTEGFRQSEKYLLWKEMLHHYYDPFPSVEHFEIVNE